MLIQHANVLAHSVSSTWRMWQKRVAFPFLTALIIVQLSTLSLAGKKIELWAREGGEVSHYADEARRWKANGDMIIIRDWQVSSAAYAVLYAWKELGVKMCYGPDRFNSRPRLYLHQTRFADPKTGKWHYRDEAFIRWGIRTPTGEKFGQRFRVMHPKEIGIPACPKGLKGDTKIVPAPYIYRLR